MTQKQLIHSCGSFSVSLLLQLNCINLIFPASVSYNLMRMACEKQKGLKSKLMFFCLHTLELMATEPSAKNSDLVTSLLQGKMAYLLILTLQIY